MLEHAIREDLDASAKSRHGCATSDQSYPEPTTSEGKEEIFKRWVIHPKKWRKRALRAKCHLVKSCNIDRRQDFAKWPAS